MTTSTGPAYDPSAPYDPNVDLAERVPAILAEITLPEQYTIRFERDKEIENGRWYLQIACERIDIVTGQMGTGYGGKAYLSRFATDSELVQTVFGLYKAFVEHEARETFTWRGRRVFGPHMDVNAVWEVARRFDARPLGT